MKVATFFRMAASRPVLDGVFGINKPVGMSSAQLIRDCQHHFNPSACFKPMIEQEKANRDQESHTKNKRRRFGKNDLRVKMGHGGTLDPLATGVLILGVGKGTKALQSFLDCTKEYEAIVLFGVSTDTYDRVGKILKKTPYDHITRPMVEQALDSYRGKFQQMPPLYSALKMEGKPLYEYARTGKALPREIATREVEVTKMELVEWYEPGEHSHHWPAEEATSFERNFAEEVWKIEKQQMVSKKLTPEEEEEETKALKEHENFKRKADENVDALVYDRANKKRKIVTKTHGPPLMSGALGDLPPAPPKPGKGSNLVPTSDPDAPAPWEDKGPPAAKIRMTVTSGFYVRSFCHDIGAQLGSSAVMAELCRSRQGDFVLGSPNCLEFSDLAKGESVWGPKVENMISLWNSKTHSKPAKPHRSEMYPPTSKKQQRRAEKESIEKSRELEDANKPEGSSSETQPLPTPNASSPLQNSKSEVTDSNPPETNGDDQVASAEQHPTTASAPAPQAAEPEDKAESVNEEPQDKNHNTNAESASEEPQDKTSV
ncbi:trub family pseudouridylate synthase-containing protein [Jackrogersella minutella]|nr:trub family pseudouridylate synthase-containing protein [Jackrogersella minutella]